MNVFHKVLLRIFEVSRGKDNVDVDLADLLKKEGFFPSIDTISSQLQSDGWITESGKHVVRITHWGAMEAKRLQAGTDKGADGAVVAKEAKALLNGARQLVVLAEEFVVKSDKAKLDELDKSIAGLSDRAKLVRSRL